ncbi:MULTISPECIES: hypothetical protein [unclassified Streptomyces]|uniref:Uncharacterized protein n=1 Tax=Streptomyces sp. R33 TaxID=3238629 RepID=A0AB39XZQ1_9ACTN|nr:MULTISPECIES: hypothetical protein [unclassified Streptomyces]KJY33454.1 hypothetical protein VR46_33585 [Streptomyces sp. NRRL S-444]KOY58679.1 hypothetical protein ADK59_06765 [Streptomyces sp. XY332]TDU75271.1 hypothetical protein EDD91_1947 [Streptomyces sp. KS 21]THA39198.1 hypothetical protein E6W17_13590 [Streptomyces sp. A1547]
MRSRRILAAVMATAALAGLGLTGVTTAQAATAQGAPSDVTPSQCQQGGGTPDLTDNVCKGGTYNGEKID